MSESGRGCSVSAVLSTSCPQIYPRASGLNISSNRMLKRSAGPGPSGIGESSGMVTCGAARRAASDMASHRELQPGDGLERGMVKSVK